MAALEWKGSEVLAVLRKGAKDGVAAGAIIFQAKTKETLSRRGTGRKYPNLRYQSSKPGHPPAVQTGHLRRSIQVDLSSLNNPKRPTSRTGTNVEYAPYLEFGTRNMPAHPFMRQTIQTSRAAILAEFARRMELAIRKFTNG